MKTSPKPVEDKIDAIGQESLQAAEHSLGLRNQPDPGPTDPKLGREKSNYFTQRKHRDGRISIEWTLPGNGPSSSNALLKWIDYK